MGLFDIFKKKKPPLTEELLKWKKMWNLWFEERAESPYQELMTYKSETGIGGHNQYFANFENTGDFKKEISALEQILSEKLKNNLNRAYGTYLSLEEKEEDGKAEEILKQYDDVFYENEEEINRLLEEYASKIEL